MPPFDPHAPTRHTVAGALVMIVIGLLIFIPSGLCTGWMGIMSVAAIFDQPNYPSEGISLLLTALVLGGPFAFGGGAMIWFGVKWLRNRNKSQT